MFFSYLLIFSYCVGKFTTFSNRISILFRKRYTMTHFLRKMTLVSFVLSKKYQLEKIFLKHLHNVTNFHVLERG